MAIRVINETVEVCDFCGRQGYLQECIRCHKKYCLTDNAIIQGCWVTPDVCRECAKTDEVRAICDEYAKKITPIIKRRHEALVKSGLAIEK